jgi:hypothetical protein
MLDAKRDQETETTQPARAPAVCDEHQREMDKSPDARAAEVALAAIAGEIAT